MRMIITSITKSTKLGVSVNSQCKLCIKGEIQEALIMSQDFKDGISTILTH